MTGFCWAGLLWLGERVLAAPGRFTVALASGFFLLVAVVPLALLAGLFLRVVLGAEDPYAWLVERLKVMRDSLFQVNPAAGFRLLNLAGWGALYLTAATFVAVTLCKSIAHEVVRPQFQAILSVAATAGAYTVLAPLLLFGRALGRRLAPLAARFPWVRYAYGRPLWPFLFLVGVGLAAVVLFLVLFRSAVAAAPWEVPAFLLGTLLLALVCGAVGAALMKFRGVPVAAGGLLLVVTLAVTVSAVRLETGDRRARRAFQDGPATALAYGLVEWAMDRDGDGFMHAFAGGDCAPDDGSISPLALDIPGNGVDEDCTGSDLEYAALERGRWDYPLPPRFPKRKLPIIIISVDALSFNHLALHGYGRETTPNLDALAGNCVVFEKAFSQGPSTRLSLAALLTGLYDTQIGRASGRKVPLRLLDENELFSETLQEAGYETVFVPPTHYMHKRWKGLLQGFDKVDTGASQREDKGPVHNAEKVTRVALRHVRRNRTAPLFLWVHYWDAHPPFGQPEGAPRFGTKKKDLYDAEVAHWDKHVKPLLEELHSRYRDGYILILTADHGSAFDKRHKRHTHGYDLHTAVLHVPLLVCSRHIPARRVVETPVSLLDIYPTLANLVGLEVETPLEGSSLVPLLFGATEWPDRVLFHQFYLGEKIARGMDPLYAVAVRDRQYNYLWNRKTNEYALYDWVGDPFETADLYGEEPELVAHFDGLLKSWLYRVYKGAQEGFESDHGGESDAAESPDL